MCACVSFFYYCPHNHRYASLDQQAGKFAGILMAMASVPAANASVGCPGRCSTLGGSRCLATVLALSGRSGLLRVDFFCLPDPSMVQSSMFPTGVDSFELYDSDTLQTAQVIPQLVEQEVGEDGGHEGPKADGR